MAKSGWRDVDGRTASERHKHERETQRANLTDRIKHPPLSLVRPILIALFFGLLILAVATHYIG